MKALATCFVVALIVPMPQLVVRDFVKGLTIPAVPTEDDLEVVFARDVAYRLRALGGREAPVVASAPTTTTWMMYFGGLRGLGTLYWENAAGLKTAAQIYSARDEAAVARLIKEHSVSHIAIFSFEPFVRDYPALLGVSSDAAGPGTVLARMADGMGSPRWARELPVAVPGQLRGAWALVYDVRRARDAR